MLFPKNNPQGQKTHDILFIVFLFGEGVAIIGWIANMNIYVYYTEELYKDKTICHLVNSATAELLLHTVQCWSECAVDE